MKTNISISMLTSIKNGVMVKKKEVYGEYSKINCNILTILRDEGYIKGFDIIPLKEGSQLKKIKIYLSYVDNVSSINKIFSISKGKCYKYIKLKDIPMAYNKYGFSGLGTLIFSTNQGILTGVELVKRKIGGKLLCGAL